MRTHRNLTLVALVPLLAVVTSCSDSQSGPSVVDTFSAALANWPNVTTSATGQATFTLFSDNSVSYRIDVANIQNVTNAHIHDGGLGATGPIVVGFFGGLFNGTGLLAEGTFSPSDVTGMAFDELITRMGTGTVYVNVHTQQNPGGEIRGPILDQ